MAADAEEIARIPADLAPGDASALRFDWSGLRVRRIRSTDHPRFGDAFERLWAEFGASREMEQREVIASRLAWDPAVPIDGYRYLYEIMVVEDDDEIVALRDHTAITPAASPLSSLDVLVHLSHVLVAPRRRGQGLAAWLRAFPLQAARECTAAGGRAGAGITLVAEMEPPERADAATLRRLASYRRAGFAKLDPARVHYAQPDLRTAAAIAATGVAPVPLALVLRRVGRENERSITGEEVRTIVAALYAMFAVHVRPEHMAPLWELHERLPAPHDAVDLVPPVE